MSAPHDKPPAGRPDKTILRPYQNDVVGRLRSALVQHHSVLLCLPTGGGKTVIFTFIARSAVSRGKRVLIIAHRQEIIEQISDALLNWGVPHGIIGPRSHPTNDLVQLASVQTLARRLAEYDLQVDLLVVDEAHHAVAGSWKKIADRFSGALILGVTATPERLDGQGLGSAFRKMVIGPSVERLTDLGFLCPAVVYTPPTPPDLNGVKSRGGDFAIEQLSRRMSSVELTGNAIAHYRRLCPNAPAIAFCVDRAHSEDVASRFRSVGISSAHIDGDTVPSERRRLIAALGSGELHVLTNCGLVSEGVDVPSVAAAILLRPTQSLALYLQQVGRALRPAPGKKQALILDHAGNVWRHGLPDAPREWSLAGTPRKEKSRVASNHERLIERCPNCGAVTARRAIPICTACGHVLLPPTTPKIEVDTWLKIAADPALIRQVRTMSYRELCMWADTEERALMAVLIRGFKRGWAWHHVRELRERGVAA